MHSAPDQQVMNDAYDHALWLRRLESPLDARDRQLCDLGHYVSQLLNAIDAGQRNCDAVYNDLKAENTALREDKALLDAFDLAGRKDDVVAHQISEDECEPELVGHFWVTPSVQSSSCRDAIRAAIGTQP